MSPCLDQTWIMPDQSSDSINCDILGTDIISWTLDNHSYDQDKKIYIDADAPERSLSAHEARSMVRKLIAGFHVAGLQPGDAVCVYAFNDV